MKTCIGVYDAQDDSRLAFISALEVNQALSTATAQLVMLAKPPTGSGSADNPFVITSFPTIVGYIEKRNAKKTGVMYFKFFGVDMYQNGNDDGGDQAYYIGLKDGATLSYPDMARAMRDAPVDTAIKSADIKNAVGVTANSKVEVLAVACLFIAEGRRDRTSLITHLILCDLISGEVKYGSAGTKTRSLRTAVDKGKSYVDRYTGVTASGDSPMSQKGAVAHAGSSHNETQFARRPTENRYFDKTISLVVQWVAHYYDSPSLVLVACAPGDEAGLKQIDAKVEEYIEEQVESITFSRNTKAGRRNLLKGQKRNQLTEQTGGVKQQVLSELASMLRLKLEKSEAGTAGDFKFTSDKMPGTEVLKKALAA